MKSLAKNPNSAFFESANGFFVCGCFHYCVCYGGVPYLTSQAYGNGRLNERLNGPL